MRATKRRRRRRLDALLAAMPRAAFFGALLKARAAEAERREREG